MKRYIRTDIVDLGDENEDIKRDMAKDPETQPRALSRLAQDRSRSVRYEAAGNRNMDLSTRQALVDDSDSGVSYVAIHYGDWDPAYLDQLVHGPNGRKYEQAVAQHKDTSAKTLSWLADKCFSSDINSDQYKYHNMYIIHGVASNRNTPPETLAKLATSPEYETRMRVANNDNTPSDVLWKLAKDRNSRQVRRIASIQLIKRGEMSEDDYKG